MSKILKVKDLSISFEVRDKSFLAVDNISFDIERNQTLALVGESGSGKSVTAMSILQLLPRPQASYSNNSSILFNDKEVIDASTKELIKIRGNIISMVFQEPMTSLNPYHRVGNQITESILLHSKKSKIEANEEAKKLMRLVEIDDLTVYLTVYLTLYLPYTKPYTQPFTLASWSRHLALPPTAATRSLIALTNPT